MNICFTAEVELTVVTKAKRGRPSRKSLLNDKKPDDILNDVREIMSAKEPEPMDVNNVETEVTHPKSEELINKSPVPAVNNSTPNVPVKSRATRSLRATSPTQGKPKIDLSNPAFQEPFKCGWKREIVYRGNANESNTKPKMADVYYVAPKGKKIRSLKEISSFCKYLLFIG